MTVSRDIAQARTNAAAYKVLCFQLLAVSIAVGAYSPHWWYGVFVPFVFAILAMFRYPRVMIVIALSAFWALLLYRISVEAGVGLWSYLFGCISFTVAYGVNAAGMIGLQHSVPDLR